MTVVNIVMGTIIAWVLVRDRFWGKGVLDVIIDVPFALPTIVAGLVLLSLYGPESPLGLHWAFDAERAVTLALAFVTLPFVVRTVQPVLEELEADVEEAAASLGASRLTIVPADHPAEPGAGDRRRRGPVVRPGDLASTARWCCCRGNLPFQHRGGLGPGAHLHRERQHRLGGRGGLGDARRRARRHRRARHRPAKGGPPWLRSPTPDPLGAAAAGGRLRLLPGRLAGRAGRPAARSPTASATLSEALADPQVDVRPAADRDGGHLGGR